MSINRRVFVKSGALALVALGLPPAFLPRTLLAQGGRVRKKTIVTIFQRGAVDGLNMVVPFGDPAYYAARRAIAIPRPAGMPPAPVTGALGPISTVPIDLDGFFAMHPALTPLHELWTRKELAIVHAVGSPHPTRSHFDAQDFMESGTPGVKETPDGWLNRVLQQTGCRDCDPRTLAGGAAHTADHVVAQAGMAGTPSTFRGVALSRAMPRSLQGNVPAIAGPDLTRFGVSDPSLEAAFSRLYSSPQGDLVASAGKDAFEAAATIRKLTASFPTRTGVTYLGELGNSLRQIAQLIKADVGLEVAFAEIGGWDTHGNQGNVTGSLATRLTELSRSLRAFYDDLGDLAEDVVVLTMSEFGRTVNENGSGGTDHGHGTCMMVLGGSVAGGKVYGKWPGLAREQLHENRDLAVTTDFRDLFGEIASKHLGAPQLDRLFPGYEVDAKRFVGVL